MLNKTCLPIGVAMAALYAPAANATIVQFQTVLGPFEVNLYDQNTPATVANFLAYVNDGAYNNTFFHRVEGTAFVAQGGGFTYQGTQTFGSVVAKPAVVNEPKYSNVRGTIAMAKLSGNPNSATNQWFINLGNNSTNLDVQNGGFTVFGQVIGNGMDVLDAINALPRFDLRQSALGSVPLRDYTQQNATDGVEITDRHLVLVTSIVVIDGAANTAANLTPVPNTLINQTTAPPASSSGGGGGGVGFGSLLALGLLSLLRRRRWQLA
jgi:peptidyl-prolyl cis-trans isomerase A (cyclophilin A)